MSTHTGSRTIPTSRAQVWRVFSDLPRLATEVSNMDDVDEVRVSGDGTLSCRIRPHAGLSLAPLTMRVWLDEWQRPDRVLLRGQGRGAEYAVDVTVELLLAERGTGTEVTWHADLRFAGVLASVGQRVLAPLVTAELDRAAGQLAEVASR